MNNRLRSAARLLGVTLVCGAAAFLAGAVVPGHSVRLGSAAAEASPRGETALNIALPVAACARYDPSAVPCEVPDGATTAMNW